MADEPDPTKDPKFKQVVDHFLKTPPKPHKRKKDEGRKERINQNQDNDTDGGRHRRSSKGD